MNERSRNIVVGITALAGLVGLAALLMLFGYLPSFVERGYMVQVSLKNAAGLSRGSRVYLDGIPVGRVDSVTLELTKRGPEVLVTTIVQEQKNLPRGVRARVEAPLIGGSPSLVFDTAHLDPADKNYPELIQPMPKDGTARLTGDSRTSLSAFAEELRAAMAEPSRSFDKIANAFDDLSREWAEVGKNINQLIEPRGTADVDKGGKIGNLATILARTDARLKELETTLAAINQYLMDQELRDNVRKTVANAAEMTGKMTIAADKAAHMMDQAGGDFRQLSKRYQAVADDLSDTLGSIKKTLDEAREGKGSLGKLVSDPALYNNLNDASQRLSAVLDEIKLTVEKLRKEGIPIR